MEPVVPIFYRMVTPGIVGIKQGIKKECRHNESSINFIINNIKNNRQDYVTEEAYRRHIAKYRGALNFLLTH